MCITEIPHHSCGHATLPPTAPVRQPCMDSFFDLCADSTIQKKLLYPGTLCAECQLSSSWFKAIPIPVDDDYDAADAALSSSDNDEDSAEAAALSSSDDEMALAKPKKQSTRKRVRALSISSLSDADLTPTRSYRQPHRCHRRHPISKAAKRHEPPSDSDTSTSTSSESPYTHPYLPLSLSAHLGPTKDMHTHIHRPLATRVAQGKGKIPRPSNAFMLYRSTYLDRASNYLKAAAAAAAANANTTHVSTVVAASWAMETDETREEFAQLAELDKSEHARAWPDYKFCPAKGKGDGLKNAKAKVKGRSR